jgi:hypothetical protein
MINNGIFGQMDPAELGHLENITYASSLALFTRASEMFGEAGGMSPLAPGYDDLMADAGVVMAAGREQNALHTEIAQVIRLREAGAASARAARVTRETILADWAEDEHWLREALLNEGGK